jgi:hypothetical protein
MGHPFVALSIGTQQNFARDDDFQDVGISARGVLWLGAAGLAHDGLRGLLEGNGALLLGEAGALVVLLERDAFEEQRVALQVDADGGELPERWRDLLLIE